jgi:hypothetical protein
VKPKPVLYDAGALIALDRRQPDAIERHDKLLGRGIRIIIPAVAAAQAIRKPARQARLMFALRAAWIEEFTKAHQAPVGELLGKAGTCDVVDAFVAFLAAREEATVYTSDVDDIRHLTDVLGVVVPILAA